MRFNAATLLITWLVLASLGCMRSKSEVVDLRAESEEGPSGATTYTMNLMGRNAVQSTMLELFGDSSDTRSVLNAFPMRSANVFHMGGGCRLYEPDDAGELGCFGEYTAIRLPQVAAPTVARTALMIQMCDAFVSVDSRVIRAINTLRGTSITTTAEVTAPSENDYRAIYDFFFLRRPYDVSMGQALHSVARAAIESTDPSFVGKDPDLEAWRFVLLTACASTEWQIQ